MVGGKQRTHRNRLVNAGECLAREVTIEFYLFSGLGRCANAGDLLHCFKWIFASGCLSTQHHRVGAVEHRIGNVAHFCAGRHGIGDHAFHHLGGSNHHAVHLTGHFDHAFL